MFAEKPDYPVEVHGTVRSLPLTNSKLARSSVQTQHPPFWLRSLYRICSDTSKRLRRDSSSGYNDCPASSEEILLARPFLPILARDYLRLYAPGCFGVQGADALPQGGGVSLHERAPLLALIVCSACAY